MNEFSEANGHDNLGFDKERQRDPDATSHQTTLTNISNNCSQNATPKKIQGKTRRRSEVQVDPSQLSVYERVKMGKQLMEKRKSISDSNNRNDTSFTKSKKSEKKSTKNKETMKYANPKSISDNVENSKRKNKNKDTRSATKKINRTEVEKIKPEVSTKNEKGIANEENSKSENSAPKKKVKIKETMSQKIKKANSNQNGGTKKQGKANLLKKEDKNNELHTKSVRLLLDQASDANETKDPIVDSNKDCIENKNVSSVTNDGISFTKDTTKTAQASPTENVNHSITVQKKNDGNIRTLERVETDDCTSIDTSTLPPPADEIEARTDDISSTSTGERFIA